MLRRNLYFCSRTTKERAYFALVRPYAEYACSLWDPYQMDQINQLEMIQRRGVRFVYNDYRREEGTVTNLLRQSSWVSLQDRRKICRLVMLFKIINNEIEIDFDTFFQLVLSPKSSTTETK